MIEEPHTKIRRDSDSGIYAQELGYACLVETC